MTHTIQAGFFLLMANCMAKFLLTNFVCKVLKTLGSPLSIVHYNRDMSKSRRHQKNLKILFYTFLHFFVKKLKKYEKDKSFICQTTF